MRRSGGLLAAEDSVAKLSDKLFLPHFGPFGPIGTRPSLRVVPILLMLISTTQGGLHLFGTEVV